MEDAVNESTKAEATATGALEAGRADAPLADENRRLVVVDILADAVMDLLLAEVEKAARGGSDELSTC